MHTIEHTRAVILKSHALGEANKMFWLFTEDLGLIKAVATGIRKPASKLRGQLRDYSFVTVDLVRGKNQWRLISAIADFDPLNGNVDHPLARPYIRLLHTIERFLVDEGVHLELFEHVYECAKTFVDIEPKKYDTLAIWRTLAHLGYIDVDSEKQKFFLLPFEQTLNLLGDEYLKDMIKLVNETIKETHL